MMSSGPGATVPARGRSAAREPWLGCSREPGRAWQQRRQARDGTARDGRGPGAGPNAVGGRGGSGWTEGTAGRKAEVGSRAGSAPGGGWPVRGREGEPGDQQTALKCQSVLAKVSLPSFCI